MGVTNEEPAGDYIVNDDTYLLKFEDGRYSGMRIEVQPLDVASMIEMSTVEEREGIGRDKWFDVAADYFSRSLVSWNLKIRDRETGKVAAVPRTPAGMRVINFDQFIAIYRAWMQALTGPTSDSDLGKDFSSGATSLERLPMTDPSSPSPQS